MAPPPTAMDLSTTRTDTPERTAAQLRERVLALEREVAELRRREEAWRERERELTDFVENGVMGLHTVGVDGTILWANEADYRPLGYEAGEFVGRRISDFHVDRHIPERILERVMAGEVVTDFPALLRCKDGSTRQVLISSNGHFAGGRFVHTRCFTRDVTEQRLVEAALQEARVHLASVVESSEDAIFTLDLGLRINSWNRGAQAIFGYRRDEIVGRSILTLIPAELHAEEREIIARLRAGERVDHYETVRVRKDGSRVDISLSVSPVRNAAGTLVGISKVARDVTEQRRAQRELAEATRRKDEFLAILAHELRNPLAPIRYALSVAREVGRSDEQRRHAEDVIERQVEHMGRLLDDLLDVSRIARGRVELRRKWIDLTSAIGAAIDSARPLLDQKGHALVLDLPREALRMQADPVRVTQILANLLGNAAKYTDRGGHIQLRARREGDEVVLSVRDDGIGIAPEMMPRLFTLFSQAHSALQRADGGLGVGLALVKGFAEMHGGRVEARSEGLGRGSEFVVRLPIGADAAEEASPPRETRRRAQRLRVLVADDNVDSAQTCAMLLELWGHEVRVAHGGREAIELARAFEPQVALLDIGMPQLNGYDVARAIRALPWGGRARLVAVTGWGQEEDKHKAAAAGFDRHLTKPVDPASLRPLVDSIS